jgi:PAS domain S-box-containing protein
MSQEPPTKVSNASLHDSSPAIKPGPEAEELVRDETLLRHAQRIVHFGGWELDLTNLADINANHLYWSDEVFRIFGYNPGEIEVNSENFFRSVHPDDRPRIEQAVADALANGTSYAIDHRILLPGGAIRYVHEAAQIVHDPASGRPLKMVGLVQDITDRHESEVRLKRLNRLYSVLSKINETIVRTADERVLCESTCRIAVEQGQLKMAWVGEIDPKTNSFLPFASVGIDDEYLEFLKVSTAGGAWRGGPAGRTLRENCPAVSHDIASDPCMMTWREHLLKRGCRSVATLPLALGENRRGLVTFYAAEPNFFNQDEVTLLVSLAENLSFALDSIRKERLRLKAEDALRKSEAHYRLLFYDSPHPMWVSDLESLRFLAVNSAARQQYGYTGDEFLAMTIADLYPHGDRPAFTARVRQWPDKFQVASSHLRKNGDIIQVEICSDVISFQGRPARLSSITNVTERKVFEQKLAEQAALIDQARDAIVLRDMENRVLFWNKGAERLYGWTQDEVLGHKTTELLRVDTEKFAAAMGTVMEKGAWSGELEQTTKAGEVLTVESRWTLLRHSDGRPKAVLVINSDVTERKKIESHLLRAQRLESIGTLASGIAHDFNNLLAPIIVGVDLLKHYGAEGPARKVVDDIERSALRGSGLVKQMLSFARGVEGSRIVVHVQGVIDELESIISNTFPKNITLETRVARDTSLIEGDPTQLSQVLLNLCVNARDSMPDGGRLLLSAGNVFIDAEHQIMERDLAPGWYVCLEVTDTGCGIPAENIDKIFDPFFTTKELTKGTGLGLSTTLGIVRGHGGFLNLHSDVGRGTTFKIYLPAQARDTKAGVPLIESGDWPRGHGEWILLVDDEPPILAIVKQILEAFGYQVLTAEHGAHAIGIFALHRDQIALVMTDMMMPVMDGPATIAALRQIDPKIRIIVASGMNPGSQASPGLPAGIKHFLAKPYTTGKMLTTLKAALSGET